MREKRHKYVTRRRCHGFAKLAGLIYRTRRMDSLIVGLVVATLALAGCHPGKKEAMRLRASCDEGNAASCAPCAGKLQKGDGVKRDSVRALNRFRLACNQGVLIT